MGNMATLDYQSVSRYWDQASPSVLAPYIMDGYGFPMGAGHFRFRAECRIVRRLTHGADVSGRLLDLGSGVGFWTEYLAPRFARVISVEGSRPLFEALEQRCAAYSNVQVIHCDVNQFQPKDRCAMVFLGGLLMYLNEEDVIGLLKKLIPLLQPNGFILCRETTVREGCVARQGEYQAMYRSVEVYRRIFAACGLSVVRVQKNKPYILLQMGCELVKKWKALVPARLQAISLVGCLVYWGLRAGYPWITRLPAAMGLAYPQLTNHFFVLQPDADITSDRNASDQTG